MLHLRGLLFLAGPHQPETGEGHRETDRREGSGQPQGELQCRVGDGTDTELGE